MQIMTNFELTQALNRHARKVCCIAAEGTDPDANILNIDDDTPDLTQTDTIQILNNGDVYVVDSEGVATRADFELTENEVRTMASGERAIYYDLEKGGITDGILTTVKNGAMTTATIDKNGEFDRIAVTGGVINTSYITFSEKYISDEGAIFSMSIQVNTLNVDGSSGTSHIGIGRQGVNHTQDTGAVYPSIIIADVIGKTATGYTAATRTQTVTSSAGTLVSTGQILDIEYFIDLAAGKQVMRIVNRTSGEWLHATSTINESQLNLGMKVGVLRISLANITATILDCKVRSGMPVRPLLYSMGDSYGIGFNISFQTSLQPKFAAANPRNFVVGCGNGVYVYSMSQRSMREVFKLKPKYVLLCTILSLFYGDFKVSDPDNANFMVQWNNMMNAIVTNGSIPIHIKWPAGGFTNSNDTAWNAFIDAQVIAYPTSKILDLTGEAIVYSDSSHPDVASYTLINNKLIELLESLGY